MATEMSKWTAVGPSLDGCHEIAPEVAERFKELGGQDIEVWGEDYVIWAYTQAACDYAVAALELSAVSESE